VRCDISEEPLVRPGFSGTARCEDRIPRSAPKGMDPYRGWSQEGKENVGDGTPGAWRVQLVKTHCRSRSFIGGAARRAVEVAFGLCFAITFMLVSDIRIII
jgi:hypothetical protein